MPCRAAGQRGGLRAFRPRVGVSGRGLRRVRGGGLGVSGRGLRRVRGGGLGVSGAGSVPASSQIE